MPVRAEAVGARRPSGDQGPPPPYPVRRLAHTPTRERRPAPRHTGMSLRIVTVAGIDIRVHATFLLLVLLVALGSTAPEGPGLVSGVAWLVALFSCVVVHELAHSLVARASGIPITEIELLPFGGISKMERAPDDPRVELRIAVVGPLASVALGVLFGAVALLAGVAIWPPTLAGGGLLARLAWVNLLLAGFNLVPAIPLDGGRVFRALLEQRMGRERATRVAARAGRMFAALMVAASLYVSLWLFVIGVFVYLGSWGEEAAATLHERIKDLHVRDVMIRRPVVLAAPARADEVVAAVWDGAQREFPVVDAQGAYVGMVTAAQLLRAAPGATVGDVAVVAPAVAPDDGLETSGLVGGELPAAAVVSGSRVVGLARAADATLVVQWRLQQPR